MDFDSNNKPILTSDRENNFNRSFTIRKPKGYIIMDTYNNPFFSLDTFKVDNSDFNLPRIKKDFHYMYGGKPNDLFLPWHYTVDVVNQTPYIINTRPLTYKNIIPNYEEHISIMIIGDSNQDIYTMEYYKAIANIIINPLRYISSLNLLNQRKDFEFKTGKNFDKNSLFKWII